MLVARVGSIVDVGRCWKCSEVGVGAAFLWVLCWVLRRCCPGCWYVSQWVFGGIVMGVGVSGCWWYCTGVSVSRCW